MTPDAQNPPESPGRPSTVLVVDDSSTIRLYHRALLEEAGFEVIEAGNGLEALELTLNSRFDLLVVDVNMPVMDGYSLVGAVRRSADSGQIPVIMVSSESEEGDATQAYRCGADLYLVKPADPRQLVQVARKLATDGRPARAGRPA